jgi:hypothetical protein
VKTFVTTPTLVFVLAAGASLIIPSRKRMSPSSLCASDERRPSQRKRAEASMVPGRPAIQRPKLLAPRHSWSALLYFK